MIASQDFVTLTLFPLLKKSQLPFLLIFYLSLGIEPERKDFGMRKRKFPPNHPHAKQEKKEICPVKTSFSWGKVTPERRGKPLKRSVLWNSGVLLRNTESCWDALWEAGPLAGPWSRFNWESSLITREESLCHTLHPDWLDQPPLLFQVTVICLY